MPTKCWEEVLLFENSGFLALAKQFYQVVRKPTKSPPALADISESHAAYLLMCPWLRWMAFFGFPLANTVSTAQWSDAQFFIT